MNYTASFIGGPRHGELLAIQGTPMWIEVPVLPARSLYAITDEMEAVPQLKPQIMRYRLRRRAVVGDHWLGEYVFGDHRYN